MIINNDYSKFNSTLYLKYYHLRIQRGARFVSTVAAASFLRGVVYAEMVYEGRSACGFSQK